MTTARETCKACLQSGVELFDKYRIDILLCHGHFHDLETRRATGSKYNADYQDPSSHLLCWKMLDIGALRSFRRTVQLNHYGDKMPRKYGLAVPSQLGRTFKNSLHEPRSKGEVLLLLEDRRLTSQF